MRKPQALQLPGMRLELQPQQRQPPKPAARKYKPNATARGAARLSLTGRFETIRFFAASAEDTITAEEAASGIRGELAEIDKLIARIKENST